MNRIKSMMLGAGSIYVPKRPTGELLAPQRGQGMGVERAVALSSMSRALKTWPQLGQRNNVVPLSMVVLLFLVRFSLSTC